MIMDRVTEHYDEALENFNENSIVGIFLQGSQNYNLNTENSDVDTKLVVVPTLDEIIFNKSPHSSTHIRENNEHIDFKDVRLMFQTFRKQNLNFVEILFTSYYIVNPLYADEWQRLVDKNELIGHYNIYRSVCAMKGMALQKFHAMEHRYPSKIEVLNKFGYDPKQLHHLIRIKCFLDRYLDGESYYNCMIFYGEDADNLKDIKNGKYPLQAARQIALDTLNYLEDKCATITKDSKFNVNKHEVDVLLDDVQRNIMRKAIEIELAK